MTEPQIEFEPSSGNVYADLGSADADDMAVKAHLTAKIGEIITARGWSEQQASKVLGIALPELSSMLRGQFRSMSEIRLLECLTRLGRDIRIVIGAERESSSPGRVEVVSA